MTRLGLLVVLLLITAGMGAALSAAWPDPNAASARHAVQHAGVPTSARPGPSWEQP